MSDHPYASCPECGRPLQVADRNGAPVFPTHRPEGSDPFVDPPCEGSGWIEDEDRCTGRWPR